MKKGNTIIAFEGLDCSFKETNYKEFLMKLRSMRLKPGFNIYSESFPRYGNWACKPVEKWLDGSLDRNVLKAYPKAVDSLYSIDRFAYWYEANEDGNRRIDRLNDTSAFNYFVFDRYNLSNTIYNPIHPGEVHIEDFVFDRDNFAIPNPDVIVWMRMRSFDVLLDLLYKKKNKDQNELDIEFLRGVWERSEQVIHSTIFKHLGIKLVVVDCLNEDNTIKPRHELADFIWESVCASV